MKHRDTLGRWFTPGVIADIPSGNLVWVDAVHGNDDLAVRERMTVPFKTLTKAKEKAVPKDATFPGDTIIVLPGLYQERNLLKNGVNWHFLPGARVEYDGSYAIFDDSANGANGAVECLIGGFGDFSHGGAGSTQAVIYTTNANTKIQLVCARMFGIDYGIVCEGGSQFLEIHSDFQGDLLVQGGNLNLRSRRLIEVYCDISGGSHWISAQEGSPVQVAMSAGNLYWEVPKTAGYPVDPAFWIAGGILRLINTVVIAGEDICSPGYGITVQDGAKCILKDSHVIDDQHTESVSGDGDLVCLGTASSNKALGTNVILLTVATSFVEDDSGVEF